MTDPTIDEPLTIDDMLGWLGQMAADGNDCGAIPAICAILEQRRDTWKAIREEAESVKHQIGLEAIRAFVERVEQRFLDPKYENTSDYVFNAMQDELASMEKGE